MKWNWEQKGWPEFAFDTSAMKHFEERFLSESGILFGAIKHLDDDGISKLRIDILSDESLRTSEIEGEYLNRASIQSSIRRHFGLQYDRNLSRPFEHGIAEMMTAVYESYAEPLSCKTICKWEKLICAGRNDLESVGCYRTHEEPMRIVSGSLDAPKIHFIAPPSKDVPVEMARFIKWFNASSSTGQSALSALTRSGIAHLYFVSIHPFEDGNGRIARALAEKSLAQAVGHPTLIALAQIINDRRKKYYDALANNSRKLEITEWLTFFARSVLDAQSYTLRLIEFVIAKNKFLARFDTQLNPRQKKVLLRIFEAGPDGFEGGLSAANYRSISKAASATATRDLAGLTAKGALIRTGERKSTRYFLNL
jgi:Fic family protein